MGLLKGCLAKGLNKLTRVVKGLPRLPKVLGWLQDRMVYFGRCNIPKSLHFNIKMDKNLQKSMN
jgi:hypothetical protein